jgi:hypothetical protein
MDSTVDPVQVLSKWPWVGVLSSHVYVVGNHRADVSHAPVYASTATATPFGATTTLACDGPGLSLPLGGSQAVVVVPGHSEQVRISARADLAWLPAVGRIDVRGTGQLRCHGVPSIDVLITAQ